MTTGVPCLPPLLQFTLNNGQLANGGFILTQVGGVNAPTYQDIGLTTPLPNPIPLNSRGEISNAAGASCQLFLPANTTYTFTYYDGSALTPPYGNQIWPASYVNGGQGIMTQATIGGLLQPQTAAESAAGVTPVNYAYAPGYEGRQGMIDDGVTDNTAALQRLVNGAAGNVPVVIRKFGSFYKLTGQVTIPANTHIILEDGATLQWTATTATGPVFQGNNSRAGLVVNGNNFLLTGRGALIGPSVASYTQTECAIVMIGPSAANPLVGFTVNGKIEFTAWGWGMCLLQFVRTIDVIGTYVHDVGYLGMFFASCMDGRVQRNTVGSVTPGTGGNAYGISCSHDSTNYSSDPNAGTKQALNPFCTDFDVSYNEVYDIPLWEGVDAHGAYETHFHHNKIYNCANPISLAGSSGAAANYAGWNNSVTDNVCTTLRRDGTASTISVTPRTGIGVSGGSTVPHQNVFVARNTVDGYGDNVVSSHSIQAKQCLRANITKNTITNWKGYAIYTSNGDGVIEGNIFDSVADQTNTVCVMLDTTNYSWSVLGNKHRVVAGTVSATGLRINNTNNPRCLMNDNDFSSATAPFGGFADGLHTLGESYPIPTVTPAGTPITVALDAVASTSNPGGPVGGTGITPAPLVVVNFSGVTGPSTIDTFSGVTVGQVLRLIGGPFTTTVDRSHCALPGSASVVLTANQVLQLLCIATSGTQFIAMSSITNNG